MSNDINILNAVVNFCYLSNVIDVIDSGNKESVRLSLWGLSNLVCSEKIIKEFYTQDALVNRVLSLMSQVTHQEL